MYLDSHRLIAQLTGLDDATDLMQPVCKPCNDPDEVLPKVFAELPPDVPLMYKSTNIDIADTQSVTLAVGKYPADREQIIEVSYENYHAKPWPWCKIAHIRNGLAAAAEHGLAGWLCLPVNMGNDDRTIDPDVGGLGRMNTSLLKKVLDGDDRTDAELVAEWVAEQFGSPQPAEAVEVLPEADALVSDGLYWDRGIPNRAPFASLHTTKLYWMFDGFADPAFPYRMADPSAETLEQIIATKHAAADKARAAIAKVHAARAAMRLDLHHELTESLTMLADAVLLARDWHSYLAVQYGIEHGVFPADRVTLGRMIRYGETFIRNLLKLADAPAGKWARSRMSFPDAFGLS